MDAMQRPRQLLAVGDLGGGPVEVGGVQEEPLGLVDAGAGQSRAAVL